MTSLKHRVPVLVPFLVAVGLAAAPGCARRADTLQLADLTPTERLYVEHFVTLERARAVALADPDLGDALLDSLGRAWSDTALEWTLHTLPKEPRRVAGMYGLLSRILNAENDSLVKAPVARRLRAPLPDPKPLSAR
ncbi:MAG: hypothetical protein ACYDIE_08010 [Candidatus Krumholzibacteriia bacterium]